MKNEFRSTNGLDYLQAPPNKDGFITFKVGTCHGLFYTTPSAFCIFIVMNDEPGNGHFTDVLEWFEFACKNARKNLLMDEILNERFFDHLIKKRGFETVPNQPDRVVKIFNKSTAPQTLTYA